MQLTQLGDLAQFKPSRLLQDIAVISLTCDVDAEDDGLVEHLIELGSSTQVLGDLGLGNNQQVPGNVHEFNE
jgi:hypothetical protein